MDYAIETPTDAAPLVDFFRSVFATSEGEADGAVIAALVRDLLTTTDDGDLVVCTARAAAALTGSVLFTRLRYPADPRRVFLLSPVAVRSDAQGRGVGQALIRFGLDALRSQGVDIVVTYGDPAFYRRVGFQPVTVAQVPPPHPLSMPHGWIAQSLDGSTIEPLAGPARSVAGFDRSDVW